MLYKLLNTLRFNNNFSHIGEVEDLIDEIMSETVKLQRREVKLRQCAEFYAETDEDDGGKLAVRCLADLEEK